MKKFLLLCLLATGCYRMPNDDDYSVIPATNNPYITHERNDVSMPNVGY